MGRAESWTSSRATPCPPSGSLALEAGRLGVHGQLPCRLRLPAGEPQLPRESKGGGSARSRYVFPVFPVEWPVVGGSFSIKSLLLHPLSSSAAPCPSREDGMDTMDATAMVTMP